MVLATWSALFMNRWYIYIEIWSSYCWSCTLTKVANFIEGLKFYRRTVFVIAASLAVLKPVYSVFVWCLVIPLHMLCRFMLRSHWPLFWPGTTLAFGRNLLMCSKKHTRHFERTQKYKFHWIFYIFIFLDLEVYMHISFIILIFKGKKNLVLGSTKEEQRWKENLLFDLQVTA